IRWSARASAPWPRFSEERIRTTRAGGAICSAPAIRCDRPCPYLDTLQNLFRPEVVQNGGAAGSIAAGRNRWQQKSPLGFAAKAGFSGPSLAVFLKRPQAENQIGAVSEYKPSSRVCKADIPVHAAPSLRFLHYLVMFIHPYMRCDPRYGESRDRCARASSRVPATQA